MKEKPEIPEATAAIAPMDIRPLIYEIRGRQVMLDRDLAALYGTLEHYGCKYYIKEDLRKAS